MCTPPPLWHYWLEYLLGMVFLVVVLPFIVYFLFGLLGIG